MLLEKQVSEFSMLSDENLESSSRSLINEDKKQQAQIKEVQGYNNLQSEIESAESSRPPMLLPVNRD